MPEGRHRVAQGSPVQGSVQGAATHRAASHSHIPARPESHGNKLAAVSGRDKDHGSSIGCNATGSPSLIVIRGNSGSGKTSTALAVRHAAGRGVALVQQDVIRRDLLRERDRPGGLNIELIKLNVQFALAHDYDVILEGILYASRYGQMIRGLLDAHGGPSFVYYYDLSLEETLRRHASKPNRYKYGEKEMAEWFVERDLLGVPGEQIIGPDQTQEETVARILSEALPPRARPGSDQQPTGSSIELAAGAR
ncbi:MAG TPA: hypothetical protein VGS97_23360 [Actinocrinis sp.]|nr:hypothetical protein [Actinocrinis sp.]